VWRETNNCTGDGRYGINHVGTAERIARAEYCNVTVPPCNQTSGFCDCDGDGELNKTTEPWFDCGNKTLREKGVLCADYCGTVCKFTFFKGEDCEEGEGNFSIYGAPEGPFAGNYHYETWIKKNKLKEDFYNEWNSVKVNMNGCTIDIFEDKGCLDGTTDQLVTSQTGHKPGQNTTATGASGKFQNLKGMCTKLSHKARCVQATRPCLNPSYDFTTTFFTDGGAIKHGPSTPA